MSCRSRITPDPSQLSLLFALSVELSHHTSSMFSYTRIHSYPIVNISYYTVGGKQPHLFVLDNLVIALLWT